MLSIFSKRRLVIFWAGLLLVTSLVTGKDSTEVLFGQFGSSTTNAPSSHQKVEEQGPVVDIKLTNNDISTAFQIISDVTGWSIFPTKEVSKAKISLWAKDIKAKELLDKVVAMAGFIYHRDGNVITVMTYGEYTQHYGLAKKVIPLTYADATSIAAVIKPFLTKLGKNVVHKETNSIVLYETDANLKFTANIIKKLDTPAENSIIEVIDIKYADCDKLAKILKEVFASKKKDAKNYNTPRI